MLHVIHGTEVDPKKKKRDRDDRPPMLRFPLGPRPDLAEFISLHFIASLVDSIDPKLGHHTINKVI